MTNASDLASGAGSGGRSLRLGEVARVDQESVRGGRGGGEEAEHEPGGDLEYQIEIDFWDAVRGAVKKLTITRLDTCETCHGTGAVGSAQTCPTCHGSGTIQQAAGKMKFNVPCTRCGGTGKIRTPAPRAAAKDACAARKPSTCAFRQAWPVARVSACPAKATQERWARLPGDLYLRVDVKPHPLFERRGDDLYSKVPVTVPEAASAWMMAVMIVAQTATAAWLIQTEEQPAGEADLPRAVDPAESGGYCRNRRAAAVQGHYGHVHLLRYSDNPAPSALGVPTERDPREPASSRRAAHQQDVTEQPCLNQRHRQGEVQDAERGQLPQRQHVERNAKVRKIRRRADRMDGAVPLPGALPDKNRPVACARLPRTSVIV